MRGLQEKGEGGIFLAIKHGCICQESKTPKEKFKPIDVTNPRTGEVTTKFIRPYNSVEALIKRVEWYDTADRYDARYMGWKIHLDANGTGCVLDLPFESRPASRFMKLAENIDYSKPVEFRAWYDSKTESTAFFVGQRENESDEHSISVPQRYTKENPGECPPPVQKFNGKWNFDDQKEFLYDRMINVVIPMVQAVSANGHAPEANGPETQAEATTEAAAEAAEAEVVDPLKEANPSTELLRGIKRTIGALAKTPAARAQMLEDYFGSRVWAEVEKLPKDVIKAGAEKLDELIPF